MIRHHRFLVWLGAAFAVLSGVLVSMPSFATTYTYNSPNYTSIGGTGTPPVYTTAMHITGSFTTAAPLPANMPFTYIGPPSSAIQTWSFNDGLHSYSASNTSLLYAYVSTDAAGNIQAFSFGGLSPLPPNTVGQPMNGFVFSSPTSSVQAASVAPCNAVDATNNNQCTSADGPNGNSFAQVPSAGTFGSSASPGSSTTVLETSLSPSAVAQSVTFTATVTGNAPTGTVTFKDGTTTLCNAVALAAGATATCTTSTLTAGSHNITAAYGGDPNNTASTSAVLMQVVTAVAPPPSLAVPAPMLSPWSVFALLLGLAGLALWRHRAH